VLGLSVVEEYRSERLMPGDDVPERFLELAGGQTGGRLHCDLRDSIDPAGSK
jgi:hypothetical protein